jgi:hypothetical protein
MQAAANYNTSIAEAAIMLPIYAIAWVDLHPLHCMPTPTLPSGLTRSVLTCDIGRGAGKVRANGFIQLVKVYNEGRGHPVKQPLLLSSYHYCHCPIMTLDVEPIYCAEQVWLCKRQVQLVSAANDVGKARRR